METFKEMAVGFARDLECPSELLDSSFGPEFAVDMLTCLLSPMLHLEVENGMDLMAFTIRMVKVEGPGKAINLIRLGLNNATGHAIWELDKADDKIRLTDFGQKTVIRFARFFTREALVDQDVKALMVPMVTELFDRVVKKHELTLC